MQVLGRDYPELAFREEMAQIGGIILKSKFKENDSS